MTATLGFRQLFDAESGSYSYLLFDQKSREAVLIDPVFEQLRRDEKLIEELGLQLLYLLETHIHADHVTSAGLLRRKFGAKVGLSQHAGVKTADLQLVDQSELSFGQHRLKVITTPGHTHSCTSYFCSDRVFTGDTLLIRGCGRTDFQQGNSKDLFLSVREKLFRLPDPTLVYPAHDYQGRTCSTIAEEKQFNPRLGLDRSLPEFEKLMLELKLEPPKKIDLAVKANLQLGEEKI